MTTLDDIIRGADPAPIIDRTLDNRARQDLDRILASPVAGPGPVPAGARRWRRRVVLAGTVLTAIAVVAAAAGAVRYGQRRQLRQEMTATGYIVTPAPLVVRAVRAPTDPAALLREIAERTAGLPDDTGTGSYAHVEMQGWYLNTEVDGVRVTSVVVPQRRSTWRAADGSGRDRRSWLLPSGEREESDRDLGPGGLSSGWPEPLSADDERLAEQLAEGHPARNGPAERFVAVTDAYQHVPIAPAVRAAMLRYLAATDGLVLVGDVTDRVGRPGIAVALDSDYGGLPTRYTVIVDPGSGRVLGFEETLTQDAGKLNVAIPSVISYTSYLVGEFTDHVR
jgi:hypothetical protein